MVSAYDYDHKKVKYTLKEDGRFIIENYNFAKPFSSFFPGIAGLYGIPMWVFYANRGQGICSFGTNSKDQPIMEFLPANQAYQKVFQRGFRTFLKLKDNKDIIFYEPFQDSLGNLDFERINRMTVCFHELDLEEENKTLGLKTAVNYFTIPSDNYAALVRTLSLTNTSTQTKTIELIDGIPQFIPYGISNMYLKKLSRTMEAWMGVENLKNNAPFYRSKVDPLDRPEVVHLKKGNFYLSFFVKGKKSHLVAPIVDPECVFGILGDFTFPYEFLKRNTFSYPEKQILQSRTPCAFSLLSLKLEPQETFTLYSYCGNMDYLDKLNASIERIATIDYLLLKKKENEHIIHSVMGNMATLSALKTFDQYCQGTFLDNVLRGGLPITLDKHTGEVIYVYSRKHGDLERDYNKFYTQPSYFSQGNGNYRDINQNRRNDIFFNPDVKDAAIIQFFNFLQLDGFNPLVLFGTSYQIEDQQCLDRIMQQYIDEAYHEPMREFLSRPFHIGDLFMFLEEHEVTLKKDKNIFTKDLLECSSRHEHADHREGYWIDHWAYNTDLLESYCEIYPEKFRELLLEKKEFTYYDDWVIVNPRSKKYVLYSGHPKQLNSLAHCEEKHQLLKFRTHDLHTVRTEQGKGSIYTTTLLQKCLCLIINKLASLDAFGAGIEMEANKPGWYDALNGLPALFGSSICETMELKRLIAFLLGSLEVMKLTDDYAIAVADEIVSFYAELNELLTQHEADHFKDVFGFWEKSASAKEDYRHKTVFGVSGREQLLRWGDVKAFFNRALKKLDKGINSAYDAKTKTFTTYFINEVTEYNRIGEEGGTVFIRPLKFKQHPLPLFLEGFVHAFRIEENKEKKRALHHAVRKSDLFDQKLGMYKVNASLDGQPEEIGRTRVFTPGWLENESVWMHMQYKYLLELLSAELFDEFYDDFFHVLIPFQNPDRYGRSILENSSFIVSSAFPDEKLHGTGFVARLSGSTSELIHMWLLMNVGKDPFFVNEKGEVCLRFRPTLHKDLFTTKKMKLEWVGKEIAIDKYCYAFVFLGTTLVVYSNPKGFSTFGKDAVTVKKIMLEDNSGNHHVIKGTIIGAEHAAAIRSGNYSRIDIELG